MTGERKRRCVLDMHDVRSIKDLVFIVGGNSESGAQKAIFEILDMHIRDACKHDTHTRPADAKQAYTKWLVNRGFDNLSYNPGAEEVWCAGYMEAQRQERKWGLDALNDLMIGLPESIREPIFQKIEALRRERDERK